MQHAFREPYRVMAMFIGIVGLIGGSFAGQASVPGLKAEDAVTVPRIALDIFPKSFVSETALRQH